MPIKPKNVFFVKENELSNARLHALNGNIEFSNDDYNNYYTNLCDILNLKEDYNLKMDVIISFIEKKRIRTDRQRKILYLAQKKSKYTKYDDAVKLADDPNFSWLENPSLSIKENELLGKFFNQLMVIKENNDIETFYQIYGNMRRKKSSKQNKILKEAKSRCK
jgi:hypothetical protein